MSNDFQTENIKTLREWLKTQEHLPYEYISDADLKIAVRSCGYNIELTKKVLDLNFTLRTMFTFYQNRDMNSMERAFQSWLVSPLPTLTNKGYRPIYCQLLNPDPEKFVYIDVVRAFIMIIDLCLYQEDAIDGIAIILNMDKVSINHLPRVDLVVAQQFFYFIQEAMFVRIKEFHFINAPSFMDKLLSMFKPFMKDELLNMLYVHHVGSKTLNEFMFLEYLPKDAGGQYLESTDLKDQIWSNIQENSDYFDEGDKRKVNESLRPGGPKSLNDIFPNLEYSFKKLEID